MRIKETNKNLLFPMPVLLIATYNEEGTVNVMNAAWGTMVDSDLILLELTKDHKTSENILREKAFTISYATIDHIKEADYFGIVSGNEVKDKFLKSGLTSKESTVVHAPIIQEYPVCLECSLYKVVETEDEFAIYGKISSIDVDDKYLDEKGRLDFDKCGFVTYNSFDQSYRVVGKKASSAFKIGLELK